MVFKRVWDSSCPQIWDKWEADGIIWTIQDLPPEDDERAIQLLLEQFCPDERLCSTLGLSTELGTHFGEIINSNSVTTRTRFITSSSNARPQGFCVCFSRIYEQIVIGPSATCKIGDFWRECISQRMSLACYKTIDNNRSLAALNVCVVKCVDDEEPKQEQLEAGKFYELLNTIKYLDAKYDAFKDMGVDKYLYGLGLLVTRENRGFKLGAKVLGARLPMCRKYGFTASSTLFTGIASQKLAAKCGYRTDLEVTLDELAQNGLPYPKGDQRSIKIMSKMFN